MQETPHAWIRARQPIENVFERQFRIFITGFAPSDHALRLLKSRGIDENDVLLFGCRVEEVTHDYACSFYRKARHSILSHRLRSPNPVRLRLINLSLPRLRAR